MRSDYTESAREDALRAETDLSVASWVPTLAWVTTDRVGAPRPVTDPSHWYPVDDTEGPASPDHGALIHVVGVQCFLDPLTHTQLPIKAQRAILSLMCAYLRVLLTGLLTLPSSSFLESAILALNPDVSLPGPN